MPLVSLTDKRPQHQRIKKKKKTRITFYVTIVNNLYSGRDKYYDWKHICFHLIVMKISQVCD